MPSDTHGHDHDHDHHSEREVWPYRKDFLISTAPLDHLIGGELADRIVEIQTREDVGERVDAENFTEDDFNALTGRDTAERTRWLYDIGDPEVDPMTDAGIAVANGVEASPVLATMLSWHISVMPGTTPSPSPHTPDLDTSSALSADAPIAVVDSGYNAESTPDWLAARVQAVDPKLDADDWDPKTRWRGHGKFVASVIVQQNPRANVFVTALKPVPLSDFYELSVATDNNAPVIALADEFSLFSAVRRLLETPGVPKTYRALNLSVGAWTRDTKLRSGLAILAALLLWKSRQPGVPIVAAAGNHNPNEEPPDADLFIPGQWTFIDDLYGVQSLSKNAQRSFFSNRSKNAPPRGAVGEALLGVLDDGTPAHWSGTSFATAVVSAHVAKTNPPNPPPPVVKLESRLNDKLGVAPTSLAPYG